MKNHPFKDSEIGPIPEDWEVKQIRQCGDVITGSTPPRSTSAFWNGNFNWVSAKDFTGKYILEAEEKITEAGKRFCRPLPCNSVLVTCIASIGLNAIAKRPCATNQQINAVVCRKCDCEYLYYQCCYNKSRLQDMAGQTAVPIISKSQFEEFAIAFPGTTDEQRRISTALSDVDEWLAALDKLIEKKKLVKQGAMQALLSGKTRLLGASGKWEEKRLKEIAPLQRGFDLPSSSLVDGPVPVVYSNGVLNYHKSGVCEAPGLVTGRSGTIGKLTFIEHGTYWPHNTSLWVTSFCENIPKFIFYLYSWIGFERFASGTGVPTLNRNDLHEYQVAIPGNPSEQAAIAEFLSDMDAELAALSREKAKAEQVKQGMMQELLTGRTRLIEGE